MGPGLRAPSPACSGAPRKALPLQVSTGAESVSVLFPSGRHFLGPLLRLAGEGGHFASRGRSSPPQQRNNGQIPTRPLLVRSAADLPFLDIKSGLQIGLTREALPGPGPNSSRDLASLVRHPSQPPRT